MVASSETPTRVLLIEDEAEIADFIVRGLSEEGFAVSRQSDGDGGLEALANSRWDVVLLDWWLPGQDGLTLLRRFRETDPLTPVLFLTARDAICDRVQGLETGADDYLCKPFAFEELLARVRALVRRKTLARGSELRYSDILVDLVQHRVERAGHQLDLTSKEFALLMLFLRHPEQVLTRGTIYDRVWDEHYDGMSNTLEVHINQLRRKLEALGPRMIQTVRHHGYVLSTSRNSEKEERL